MSNVMRCYKAVLFALFMCLAVFPWILFHNISYAQGTYKANDQRIIYSIAIDRDGTIHVLDSKGEPVKKGSYPIKMKEGQMFQPDKITLSRFKGSHYVVVDVNGVPYKIMLPH